tara:strand:+ start:107 stop:1168 length:1062 start_codon:yes stop_codon:yes gene_type:complete
METKVSLDNQSFFGKGVEFWLGMIVKFDKQKSQTAGMGWGWRYKVRIIGDYSNLDSIEDQEVHTAVALIPTTGGTGGAGKKATVKLTQGDVVFGAFLSPNNNFPVILGALGRTKESFEKTKEDDNSKFAPISGFTGEQTPGLTQDQEYAGQDQIKTPIIREGTEKGNGKSKASPTEKLSDVKGGNDPNENAVDAAYQPRLTDAKRGKDLWDMEVGESALDSNQRDEIIADMNRENNINNSREVLNGTAPADDKEVLEAQRTFAKKYDEKVEEVTNKSGPDIKLFATDTGNYRRDDVNRRKNALLLKNRYGGTGNPITIGNKTYQPWDPNYLNAINEATVIPSSDSSDEAFDMF